MTVVANNVTASPVTTPELSQGTKARVFKPSTLIPQQTLDVDGIDLVNDQWCWFGVGYISRAGRAVDDDLGDITMMCADLLQVCKQRSQGDETR